MECFQSVRVGYLRSSCYQEARRIQPTDLPGQVQAPIPVPEVEGESHDVELSRKDPLQQGRIPSQVLKGRIGDHDFGQFRSIRFLKGSKVSSRQRNIGVRIKEV